MEGAYGIDYAPVPMQIYRSPLEARMRSVSDALRGALEQVLSEALGADSDPMRPVQITQQLGLNKTLAGRVVRAIYEQDSLQALLRIPTPQGLQLISLASERVGAATASLERLARSTRDYGELLAEFSGGRTDLEAILAGWLPDQRARAERDARRSVFRGMTTLAGTRGSADYHSLYLLPSQKEPDRLDSLSVTVRQDLRRLQPLAEIVVFGPVADAPDAWRARRRTLQGRELNSDPRSMLVPELCSHPIPALEFNADEPGAMSLRVAAAGLDVNEPATLGLGWRTDAAFPRFAAAESDFGRFAIRAAKPVEAVVVDLFVHRDLALAGRPIASLDADVASSAAGSIAPPREDSVKRKAAPSVLDLDADPSGLASQDVRSCKAIAENVCREAGVRLEDFAKYRTRMEFPVGSEELTLWWPLPRRLSRIDGLE